MSAILDRGSLLFASLAALAVSFLLPGISFYAPLLVLAAFYVPGILLIGMPLAGARFDRDYSPMLACTAMAWTAASLPLAIAARVVPGGILWPVAGAACLYFAILMFFAVRTVLGAENGATAGIVCLSWIPLVAAYFLWGPLRMVLGWLASPFFLFYAWYYLGGEIGNLGAGLRSRQNFHRLLEAAAINPHDGDAQYQLGLIYQQRRQTSAAVERFTRAVQIDPTEADAHFQLGIIAREQGRIGDALRHLQTVLKQDPKHNQSEILRELGAAYLAAGQAADARRFLEEYIERRPYDPEGLVHYGEALEAAGEKDQARDAYTRAIEAARTAPRYRRRITARWSRAAQKQLRKL